MHSDRYQQLLPRPLPRELSYYILSFLPRQDFACNVRLSCNEAATSLRNTNPCKTVSASKPVPVQFFAFFAASFGSLDAISRLSIRRRRKLLELTASTGSLDNVKVLVERAGLPATADAMAFAAAEGHLPVSQWLHGRGCLWQSADDEPDPRRSNSPLDKLRYSEDSEAPYPAMRAAAQGGHLETCQWLRGAGCPSKTAKSCIGLLQGATSTCANGPCDDDVCNDPASAGFDEAVAGGHRALCEFMLNDGCWSLPSGLRLH